MSPVAVVADGERRSGLRDRLLREVRVLQAVHRRQPFGRVKHQHALKYNVIVSNSLSFVNTQCNANTALNLIEILTLSIYNKIKSALI